MIPSVGHDFMQLKHPIHALKSIFLVLLSMQLALQTFSHAPHSVHVFLSTIILNIVNRDNNPRTAPAGQNELQKSRPWKYERYVIKTEKNIEPNNIAVSIDLRGISYKK
jgi:hypothetical protein